MKRKRENLYQDLTKEEQRTFRSMLDHIKEKRKEQIELFEKEVIGQLRLSLDWNDEVKKGKISIDEYVHRQVKLGSFIHDIFK